MSSTTVQRYVFRELREGDLEKFNATSSFSGTGGGARDIRFRQPAEFDPLFAVMFPGRRTINRRAGGVSYTATIYHANVAVHRDHTNAAASDPRIQSDGSGNEFIVDDVEYWPSAHTGRYAAESRLGQISKLTLSPPTNEGNVFVLILQDGTPLSPRLAFLTEASVQGHRWEKSVNDFFADLFLRLPGNGAVMGYRDVVNNRTWVNI